MKLTPNFSVEEFGRPQRVTGGKIFSALDYPSQWVNERLRPLCEVLEVIRAALGDRAMHIGSGYRDPAYNVAIGGARFSQHMEGRAADIEVAGIAPADVHKCVLDLHAAKRIVVGGLGQYPTFTHVDIRPGTYLVRWQGGRVVPG